MNNLKTEIIEYIKNYVESSHAKGVVLGMSGGKDSLVVAKLCAEAIGSENVFGVIMPKGEMTDIDDAVKTCEFLKIKYEIANIENSFNDTVNLTKNILKTDELSSVTLLNISPRLRMNLLYAVGGTLGYLVANTSNLSEKMVGYSTKWGDGVGDFAPLANLTKTEVCKLGIALGLPNELVNKKPADGLTGKTDEDVMGFSYSELDNFIRNGIKGENFEKILKMHKVSAHKRNPISSFSKGIKNYFDEI
jgi:NAD+ synthase